MRKPWVMLALLLLAVVAAAAVTTVTSEAEAYDTYLTIEPGSVWCRQGISGPGGDTLEYVAWLTDPGGATIGQDERSTTNWRLDGSYRADLTYSGTYTCWARFYVNGSLFQQRTQQMSFTAPLPTGETTNSGGWSEGGIHMWNQQLTGNHSWNGRQTQEQDPGGGGPDTCWFAGSQYAPFTAITGGTWSVDANNSWGPDFVGWFGQAVNYYRAAGRAPCQTSFPQRMEINNGTSQSWVTYLSTTLAAGFSNTHVWSQRSGQYAERQWP